jgi:hypothetical protein
MEIAVLNGVTNNSQALNYSNQTLNRIFELYPAPGFFLNIYSHDLKIYLTIKT